MEILLHVVHILSALALIGLVLIQQGKGADAGASFGGGASNTLFGSAGAGNFLTRATAILAAVFMVSSLGLAWVARQQIDGEKELLPALQRAQENIDVPQLPVDVPVLDAPAAEGEVPALPEAPQE